jgi:hypothetical protein
MDLVSRFGRVFRTERWITMKKLCLFALLVCLAVAGCAEDNKGKGSGSAAAPAPTSSAS